MPRAGILVFLSLIAAAAVADELDAHRAAVLDTLLREIAPEHRREGVFVRMREKCRDDPSRHEGCVDLSDDVLARLSRMGHKVSRVPEASRYYIYGPPSSHQGEHNPPPPDWLYLPIYTPTAEWRTYCEVRFVPGLYPDEGRHLNGACFAAEREVKVLASGDFLVRREGKKMVVERFVPPPGCILPYPPSPEPQEQERSLLWPEP